MVHDFLMWAGSIIATGVFGLIGWVFKMVFDLIRGLESNQAVLAKSISDHKIHAAETFATKTDVRDGFDRLMTKLDKIDDKLDTKADKKGN